MVLEDLLRRPSGRLGTETEGITEDCGSRRNRDFARPSVRFFREVAHFYHTGAFSWPVRPERIGICLVEKQV